MREEIIDILQLFSDNYDKLAQELLDDIIINSKKGMEISKAIKKSLKDTEFFEEVEKQLLLAISDSAYLDKDFEYNEEELEDLILNEAWTPDDVTLAQRLKDLKKTYENMVYDSIMSTQILSIKVVSDLKKAIQENKYNNLDSIITNVQLLYGETNINGNILKDDIIRETNILKAKARHKEILEEDDISTLMSLLLMLPTVTVIAGSIKSIYGNAKSRYSAIATTECPRIAYEVLLSKTLNDDTIFGYKWDLSPIHGRFPYDICDVNAGANIGYGVGVYPKDKIPYYPAHTHCICIIRTVKLTKKLENATYDENGVTKYLNKQSKENLSNLFTKNNLDSYKNGENWENTISHWKGYEKPTSRFDK